MATFLQWARVLLPLLIQLGSLFMGGVAAHEAGKASAKKTYSFSQQAGPIWGQGLLAVVGFVGAEIFKQRSHAKSQADAKAALPEPPPGVDGSLHVLTVAYETLVADTTVTDDDLDKCGQLIKARRKIRPQQRGTGS